MPQNTLQVGPGERFSTLVKRKRTETRVFVVKVASRCNLACTYCYMYEHADQSWRDQPIFMSRETVRTLSDRLEEHARTLSGGGLMVVAHGGEPLLYPDLDFFFGEMIQAIKSCKLLLSVQTNGTAFNEDNLAVLAKYGVRIGISVDGSREVHNRVRITH